MHAFFSWGAPEYVIERTQWVPQPPDEAFAFFQDPQNLPRITPQWLDFKILRMDPDRIEQGTKIDYTLRWFGIRYGWRTLIEDWTPGVSFVDTQESGPYILWHHTHTFEASGGGTLLKDRVRYRLPFGPIGSLARTLIVRRQLEGIFDHRMKKIAELLCDGRIVLSGSEATLAR